MCISTVVINDSTLPKDDKSYESYESGPLKLNVIRDDTSTNGVIPSTIKIYGQASNFKCTYYSEFMRHLETNGITDISQEIHFL